MKIGFYVVLVIAVLLIGSFFLFSPNEIQEEKYEEALGPIILTLSEKSQVREIRKDTNVLIYIPEEKTLLGTTKELSKDNIEIKEIVKSWINQDQSIKEILGEAN
jgi:hypothetical protein